MLGEKIMPQETFKALLLEQDGESVQPTFRDLTVDDLPQGDVLVSIAYSTLNYKDALAITNKGKIIRNFPFIPGVDFSGTVEQSQSPDFKPGDQVILTGWGVGERHWGGHAQKARVKADWLVPLPDGLSLQEAMGIGTAGFTAMLSIMALEEHGLRPDEREVLVTGASGGLGSIAVAVLSNLGYHVTAASSRTETHAYLQELGASSIIDSHTLSQPSKRPLESARWGAAIDTVGGETLAGVLRTMAYASSVASCGNAGSNALSTTVLPFILRAVSLLGIDSVSCPQPRRRQAWSRLQRDLPKAKLRRMIQVVPLEQVPALSDKMIKGQLHGRTIIDVNQ
jgi:acrylyl-CoA reductase (NADPH)